MEIANPRLRLQLENLRAPRGACAPGGLRVPTRKVTTTELPARLFNSKTCAPPGAPATRVASASQPEKLQRPSFLPASPTRKLARPPGRLRPVWPPRPNPKSYNGRAFCPPLQLENLRAPRGARAPCGLRVPTRKVTDLSSCSLPLRGEGWGGGPKFAQLPSTRSVTPLGASKEGREGVSSRARAVRLGSGSAKGAAPSPSPSHRPPRRVAVGARGRCDGEGKRGSPEPLRRKELFRPVGGQRPAASAKPSHPSSGSVPLSISGRDHSPYDDVAEWNYRPRRRQVSSVPCIPMNEFSASPFLLRRRIGPSRRPRSGLGADATRGRIGADPFLRARVEANLKSSSTSTRSALPFFTETILS